MSEGRALAASILAAVDAGQRLDVAWEASGADDSTHRSWVRALVYGAIRLRGRLDHMLRHVSGRDPAALDPPVRLALRMGAYQLLEMKTVPSYAAVSESVRAVKQDKRSRAAAGLVNAVLRKLAATSADSAPFPKAEEDLEGFLCTWGSHPRWLVRRWLRSLGPRKTRRIVEANNEEPATHLRPLFAQAARRLADAGIAATIGAAGSIRLGRGVDPRTALQTAPSVVQDPAASWVVDYAAPEPGTLVLDLCAAPGGKALALSGVAGAVVAADASPRRLARVADSLGRLRAMGRSPKVWPVAADARRPALKQADMALLDAPCSATGVIRRRPDVRWRLSAERLHALAALQREMLGHAAAVVPPSGLLVYATCSMEPEENGGQVKDFLSRHADFRMEPGPAPEHLLDAAGCLSVLPAAGEDGHDGAFAARMRKEPRR